jgi:hypothetical protein
VEACDGAAVAAKIARVSTYKLVYPTGETVQREGDVPPIGYDVDRFRVDYVRDGDSGPVVFLGLHFGQADVVKLVFIEVGAERCPVTLAEAAELADRARALSGGNLELPHTALAVRLEQLVEEDVEVPVMSMLESEWMTLRGVIARWSVDETLPMRVATLHEALVRHES